MNTLLALVLAAQVSGTPAGNSIILNWSIVQPVAPQTHPVSTNIYRAPSVSQANCGAAPYIQVGQLNTIIGPYTDSGTTIAANNSYCYYVTSVDAQGGESAPSNYAYVVVPASTTCSTTNPCAAITYTNNSMSASPTYDNTGKQTSGPGAAILWYCMGGQATCNVNSLTTAVQQLASGATVQGAWQYYVFTQNVATVTYNDQQPYGSLMNYAVANQWATASGAIGTAAGPVSNITIFSFPSGPPASQPAQPTPPSASLSTGGNVGPQSVVTRRK